MKNYALFPAVFIALLFGCSSAPPTGTSPVVADESAALLQPRFEPDRRESYAILTAGPCEERLFGTWTRQTFATPILRGRTPKEREAKVQSEVPLTISYSFYISDKACTVAGTVALRAGRRYIVDGARRFEGSILPVSTGCEIQIKDAETDQIVPLLPPIVRPGFTQCERPR